MEGGGSCSSPYVIARPRYHPATLIETPRARTDFTNVLITRDMLILDIYMGDK
jgi:hypothetical protein